MIDIMSQIRLQISAILSNASLGNEFRLEQTEISFIFESVEGRI